MKHTAVPALNVATRKGNFYYSVKKQKALADFCSQISGVPFGSSFGSISNVVEHENTEWDNVLSLIKINSTVDASFEKLISEN